MRFRWPRPTAAWWRAHCPAIHDDGGLLVRTLEGVRAVCDHLNTLDLPHRFHRLEALIMATFAEAADQLTTLTDEMAAKLTEAERVNAELRAAVRDGDLTRAAALEQQAAEHTAVVEAISDRLRGIGTDPTDPVPDLSPLPEGPAVETGGDETGEPTT